MEKKDIIEAWARIRQIDQTIPDDVLDFMKDAAIEKLEIGLQNQSIIQQVKNQLADDIDKFVDKYASLSPNFEPESEDDIDGKYTGPDVYELLRCAQDLREGRKPVSCNSSWMSGCYYIRPGNKEEVGRYEHDFLVKTVYTVINS